MQNLFDKMPFRYVNYIYWLLLVYMLAALAWWYVELNEQNDYTYQLQRSIVLEKRGQDMEQEMLRIQNDRKVNQKQYLGEGLTFFLIIIVASGFVYVAVRRQFMFHQQQKNFMMAVTHELKTPIAVTKLSLETLKRHKLDEEKQHKIITDAISETDRLTNLCNNILLSSQFESGGYKLDKQPFDLSELSRKTILDFERRFPKRTFEHNIDTGIVFEGDSFLLGLVLNNLLDNAIKYTDSSSPIILSLKSGTDKILLSVADHGEGIPDIEKNRIFDKFYRMGDETKRRAKGTGLGLYLSSKIIKDHFGSLKVKDNEPQGSVFTISLQKKST